MTRDEARRIAANIAKLPQGAAAEATGLYRPHFRYDLDSFRPTSLTDVMGQLPTLNCTTPSANSYFR
jgi:hypothetical protein